MGNLLTKCFGQDDEIPCDLLTRPGESESSSHPLVRNGQQLSKQKQQGEHFEQQQLLSRDDEAINQFLPEEDNIKKISDEEAAVAEVIVAPLVDLPFLNDPRTVSYLKQNSLKVMFLMRGLPGSGKSTVASSIQNDYDDVVVCSSDQFFMVDGVYRFDRNLLGENHKKSQNQAETGCRDEVNYIVVDNTNILYWEAQQYFKIAAQYGYVVVIVEPSTPWKFNPDELERRNCHNVSRAVIEKKLAQYEQILPLYYGWFLGTKEAEWLRSQCMLFFDKSLRLFDDWASYFPEEGATEYFQRDHLGKANTVFHCTSKFIGNRSKNAADHAVRYARKKEVMMSLGQMFRLEIIGFVITRQTMGARVRLGERQLALWEQEDDMQAGTPAIPDVTGSQWTHFETIRPTLKYQLPSVQGARAHVTIGCRRDTDAKQTGMDQLELVRLERSGRARCNVQELANAFLCNFPEFGCAVYLKQPYRCDALFSGYY